MKTYKTIPAETVCNIENEAKSIAEKLNLDDRINTIHSKNKLVKMTNLNWLQPI